MSPRAIATIRSTTSTPGARNRSRERARRSGGAGNPARSRAPGGRIPRLSSTNGRSSPPRRARRAFRPRRPDPPHVAAERRESRLERLVEVGTPFVRPRQARPRARARVGLDQRPRQVGGEAQAPDDVVDDGPLVRALPGGRGSGSAQGRSSSSSKKSATHSFQPQPSWSATAISFRALKLSSTLVNGSFQRGLPCVSAAGRAPVAAIQQPERVLVEAEPDVQAVLLDARGPAAAARPLAARAASPADRA